MKKKLLISVIVVLMIIVCGVLLANVFGWFNRPNKQQIRFMTEINAANSIVWYYGDLDPGKEITLNYQKVTKFTDETIGDENNKYLYHAIVIFDFDGKMDISNEELLLIKDYCENRYYDLIYYGTSHLEQFAKCGFFTEIDSGECGFSYNGSYWINRNEQEQFLNPYLVTGNWTKDDNDRYNTKDKQKIWKFVIQFMVDLVKDSNGDL